MIKLTGTVSSGHGVASKYLAHIKSLIEERIGIENLQDGTFNLVLKKHFPIEAIDSMITREEFNSRNQWIKLKRCRVQGINAVIIRPEHHNNPAKKELYYRLELMSQYHLREKLNVNNGDAVTVEIYEDNSI